jgi:hypothetical protein
MRKLFAILALAISFLAPRVILAADTAVASDPYGLNGTADASGGVYDTTSEQSGLAYFIGNNIIQPVFGLVGLGFFCLTVYAGVLWMTAQGESKKVDKAKDILVTAVIGTVIVISSYILTNAVFNALTTGDVNGTPTATP